MPVGVRKIAGAWRVVEPHNGNKIARNKAGTSVDGPGHKDRAGAMRQARAINANLNKAQTSLLKVALTALDYALPKQNIIRFP